MTPPCGTPFLPEAFSITFRRCMTSASRALCGVMVSGSRSGSSGMMISMSGSRGAVMGPPGAGNYASAGSARRFGHLSFANGFRIEPTDVSMPDDLRHPGCRRRVAAALGADDAVDDGHADAGEIAELHAVEDVLAGGMLRLVHDDEVGRTSDLDQAAVQRAHSGGVAGCKAECDFRRHLAERR